MNKHKISVLILVVFIVSVLNTPLVFGEDNNTGFNPKPASASLYNLGLKSFENGDSESAISYFKRAVELDPEFLDAYYNLGAIYKKKGDYENASASFDKAYNLDKSDIDVVYELASSYLLSKDYSSSQKYFKLIPTSYYRYQDAKKNLDKINEYLIVKAPENATKKEEVVIVSQKIIEKKTEPEDIQKTKDAPISQNQANLLSKVLSKPSEKIFKQKYRIISEDFKGPAGVVKDTVGNIYVANFSKNTIEKISIKGKKEIFVDNIGINKPVGLEIDENNNLYVANYGDGSIVKITPTRQISALATGLKQPYYLYYDQASKSLYATSQGNNSLIQISTINIEQPISFK